MFAQNSMWPPWSIVERRTQNSLVCSKIFTSSKVMLGKLAAKIASKSERSWHHGRTRGRNEILARLGVDEWGVFCCDYSALPPLLLGGREIAGSRRFCRILFCITSVFSFRILTLWNFSWAFFWLMNLIDHNLVYFKQNEQTVYHAVSLSTIDSKIWNRIIGF